jgi:hypothetical protein
LDAKAVSILNGLLSIPWISVAFLLDSAGRMLASVGSHPAFSPSGEFRVSSPVPTQSDPNTCLYMTAVTKDVYLGVLFSSDVPIEDVRQEVARCEPELVTAVTA